MNANKVACCCLIATVAMVESSLAGNEGAKTTPTFSVDASQRLGSFRPLNGVNGAPRINLLISYDNSEYFREFNPPLIRTHDSLGSDLDTCDIHAIFPDFDADENDPANYRFEPTDLHLKSIMDVGAKVFFRLGESIEHGSPKYHVHPPADFKKWARICRNIVRHYNMGWANGFEWNIQYWEIWNEPNVPACWAGTMDQYCELYRETAVALKQLDPSLKVGGPGLAGSLDSDPGKKFLAFCRDNKVPLDFVSWHGYSDNPAFLMSIIERGLAAMKEYGFKDAESHFNEWNYSLAGSVKSREKKRENFLRMRGGPGAAMVASLLAYMQDSELDVACFYSAYGTIFRTGFFDAYGVPSMQFHAFKAFNQLVQCGTRIGVSGNNRKSGLGVVAAVDEKTGRTAVLLSNQNDAASRYVLEMKNLPIKGSVHCTEYAIDDRRALERDGATVLGGGDCRLEVDLPKASVRLILFTPEAVVD